VSELMIWREAAMEAEKEASAVVKRGVCDVSLLNKYVSPNQDYYGVSLSKQCHIIHHIQELNICF
jgi:hypothetical protein